MKEERDIWINWRVLIDNTELTNEVHHFLSECQFINVAELTQKDAISKVLIDLKEIDIKKYKKKITYELPIL